MRNAGQSLGTGIVAELEVDNPEIKDTFQQLPCNGGPMRVGLPDEARLFGKRGHQLEHRGEMKGGLAAQDHQAADAAGHRDFCILGEPRNIERSTRARVPAFGPGDTEGAAEIASTEGDGEDRGKLKLIRDLDLGGEDAGLGPCPAGAELTCSAVGTATVRAKLAVGNRPARLLQPPPRRLTTRGHSDKRGHLPYMDNTPPSHITRQIHQSDP